MSDLVPFFSRLVDPHYAWGHIPYVLLVVSMLMRNMVWLRVIAVSSGISRILIRALVVYDPLSVFWESLLVAVNLGQLVLLWWESRRQLTNEDEKILVATILPDAPPRAVRRLLGAAEWAAIEAGTELTRQGEQVAKLMFVADGAARIERGGQMIAICSRGDFVGEMSFIAGGGASATVVADRPMRIARFDRDHLRALIARDPDLRRALEASFNRNLIDKLLKSGVAPSAVPA